ncbi:esterase-like activity of phytase family protein [Inquilinus limosus]|uniref:esterase-like activity of phytase family protein n=1 Tax=Inquilinus limosus TaxID=171674 RepID=UPI00040B930A|nr:esterase-like activity of phytase family protein [Inquilinus limosus]
MARFGIVLGVLLACAVLPAQAEGIGRLRLIGEATLPKGLDYEGTTVGGLSGLDWDPAARQWIAFSDDRSEKAPARFYALSIDYDAEAVRGIAVTGVTLLRDAAGQSFPPKSVDPEAVRRDPATGLLYWSSEGGVKAGIDPTISVAAPDGAWRRGFDLPRRYRVSEDKDSGPRDNLTFEGVALAPDGRTLFVSMESALVQDGPVASLDEGSPVRIAGFDTATGRPGPEYVYMTDPIPTAPLLGGHADNGVSEILPAGDGTLLVLERAYAQGRGNSIRLYRADPALATDVSRLDSLFDGSWLAMPKTLLLDFGTLGVALDNFEAMGWGPALANGHRSLVVLSDDNFNPLQVTKALVFEVLPD